MPKKKTISDLLALLRPYSWIKNLLIFVPLFFARDLFDGPKFFATAASFAAFCLSASAVYILNDISDREQDRKHSLKKDRPIASGAVTLKSALAVLGGLLAADALLIFLLVPGIWWLIGLYFLLNLLYSKYLKHEPVIDILLVSSFYFIRIIVGGVAAGTYISNWLLLCTVFVALFLITAKRLAEFGQDERRAVLSSYTPEFLKALLAISATLLVISYSLYGVLTFGSYLVILSIFPVLLGVLRYLFLVFTTHRAEYPERLVVADKVLLASGLLWIFVMYLILYANV